MSSFYIVFSVLLFNYMYVFSPTYKAQEVNCPSFNKNLYMSKHKMLSKINTLCTINSNNGCRSESMVIK